MSLEGELCYINNKGGIVLLTEGYSFYKVKNFKNGAALWRYSSYKNKKCCGNIIIMVRNIFMVQSAKGIICYVTCYFYRGILIKMCKVAQYKL